MNRLFGFQICPKHTPRLRTTPGVKQKMPAVWKEVREQMSCRTRRVEIGHCYDRSTDRFDAKNGRVGGRREQNHSIAVPRCTVTPCGAGEDLHSAVCNIDTFKLVLGKEADRPAVRRPERKFGTLCSGEDS